MRKEAKAVLIECEISMREALQRLCECGKGVLFLVENGVLKASLSDGDVRRYLLDRKGGLDAPAMEAANISPRFLFSTERERAVAFVDENKITAVPIVDEFMHILDVAFLRERVPMDDVEIRELKPEDLGIVLEFFDQMAGDTRAMFNRNDVNRYRVVEYLNSMPKDQIHFAATVKTDDGSEKMVGYVFLWDIDTKLPWLGIAVREEWKGHHLGRQLLEYIDAWAAPRGYGGIMLTSIPANIRAHSLYSRMGYVYYGVYPDSEFLYIKRYSCSSQDLDKTSGLPK